MQFHVYYFRKNASIICQGLGRGWTWCSYATTSSHVSLLYTTAFRNVVIGSIDWSSWVCVGHTVIAGFVLATRLLLGLCWPHGYCWVCVGHTVIAGFVLASRLLLGLCWPHGYCWVCVGHTVIVFPKWETLKCWEALSSGPRVSKTSWNAGRALSSGPRVSKTSWNAGRALSSGPRVSKTSWNAGSTLTSAPRTCLIASLVIN